MRVMDRAGSRKVQDKDGVWGTVVPASLHLSSNTAQVVVQTKSGQPVLVPKDILVQQLDGHSYVPRRLAELEHARSEPGGHQDEPLVVPVLVEELEVQKRLVETGKVRMTTVVHAREALVDAPLLQDNVAITRVPMQRVVEGPGPVREEHGTTIISMLEEVVVVEKCWMLREEIHLRTQRSETHQPQRSTLRREDVQVERIPHADEHT
jgi:uncharacterized protein (TIGR02271 family)